MKKTASGIAAAILAGGKNSRMGGFNKSFIRMNGVPIIEIALAVLKRTFEEIIIVTNTNANNEFCRDSTMCCPYKEDTSSVIITEDLIKEAGPLAGIHSALSRTSKEAVFFTACDMPFLHNGLIKRQVACFDKAGCECLVPRLGSFIEPLHAIYKAGLKEDIEKFLKGGREHSIRGFLKTADVYYWDLKENPLNSRIFTNLNTEEDLIEAKGEL